MALVALFRGDLSRRAAGAENCMAIFLVVMPFSDPAPTFHRRSLPLEDLDRRRRADAGGARISSRCKNKAAEI